MCFPCVGDSLTHGMYVYDVPGARIWQKVHPYSIRLQELFNNNKRPSNVTVFESGISGEQTDSMEVRIRSVLSSVNPMLVIILGGTNDIGGGVAVEKIMKNIRHMHRAALKHLKAFNGKDSFTIAVTLPQFPLEAKAVNKRRLELNKEIRKFAERCQFRVKLFDMESLFDQNDMANNQKYWSVDNFHFSPLGYDTIGELLFKTILNFNVTDSDNPELLTSCFHL